MERGYDYEDLCTVSPEKMPNYEEKIKSFYEEHIHSDEVCMYRLPSACVEGGRRPNPPRESDVMAQAPPPKY